MTDQDNTPTADTGDVLSRYVEKFKMADYRATVAESVVAAQLVTIAELRQTIADELATKLVEEE